MARVPNFRRRRRLGRGGGGSYKNAYARTMGLTPVPVRRRPRGGSSTMSTAPSAPRRDFRTRGASYTATQTRRKRRPRPGHVKKSENSSISATRWGRPAFLLTSVYKKLTGRRLDRNTGYKITASALGEQAVTEFAWGTFSDLIAVKDGLLGLSSASSVKMYLGYLKYKICIKNQTNMVTRMTIYDVALKGQPMTISYDSPMEMWRKGTADLGVGTTSDATADYRTPFTTPHRSPEFRKFYRIVKVTTVQMEPGQQHEHTIYRRFNWLGDSSKFDIAGASLGCYPFYTACMIVQCGSIVSGAPTSAPTTTAVSLGATQYDFLTSVEYTSALHPGTIPTYVANGTYVKDIAAPRFMGEDQDTSMAPADPAGGGGNNP